MTAVRVFSSGDPIADRRASFAETLAHLGDLPAALEAMSAALDCAPNWTAGWFRYGEWCALAERADDAKAAWERVLALDPTDVFGAGLKRDLLRGVPIREDMPPAFVELLFDQYAPRFEKSLTEKLGYRGPEALLSALGAAGFQRAEKALDLGCGTGLAGVVLRDRVNWLAGYDLSSGMLAEASCKGIYDCLEKRDISQLEIGTEPYDLIVAADVFIYIGALERVIGWCAGSLSPGGYLAFTVELGTAPVHLQPSQRFAHSQDYIEALLRDAGLNACLLLRDVIRKDRGDDVPALVVVSQAPLAPPRGLGDVGDDEIGAFA